MPNLACAAATFATGASVLVGHSYFLRWGFREWPMLVAGLALLGSAFALVRRRPPLGVVVATQGIASAVVVNQAAVVVFGQSSFSLPSGHGPLFTALLAASALALGSPLLAPHRTRSAFAPRVHRRVLLVGAVASVAAAVLYGNGAAHAVWHPHVFAVGLLYGSVALLQVASVFGILRMRGVALLVGLAATLLGAILAATSHVVVLVPPLACSLLAVVAYAVPLLRLPSTPKTISLVRVASPPQRQDVEEETEEVASSPSDDSAPAGCRR